MSNSLSQREAWHPAIPWISDHLQTRRLARRFSRPGVVRELTGVSLRDAENFELRGPPASVGPLFAYALVVDASDELLHQIGGDPTRRFQREHHRASSELALLRAAMGVTQEQVSLTLPYEFSRLSIARLERGHLALAAQRFVRYASALEIDLRLLAELLSIAPRTEDDSPIDTQVSIPVLLERMRAPARRGDLFAVFQLAAAVRRNLNYVSGGEWGSKLRLSLSIACALDRRWRAARFFADTEDTSLPAAMQRAFINCESGDPQAARCELALLIHAAEDRGATTSQLLQYQLGHAARMDHALTAAHVALSAVAQRTDEPDLRLSALAELALVEGRPGGDQAVKRTLDAANEIAPVCDESVSIFRQIQFSRAARRAGLSCAATLAHTAAERAASIGYQHGYLLALIQLQDQAQHANDTGSLCDLDRRVLHTSLRVHLDETLRRRFRHTARRVRQQGRTTRRVVVSTALPAPTTPLPR